jgi:hypothetical protein
VGLGFVLCAERRVLFGLGWVDGACVARGLPFGEGLPCGVLVGAGVAALVGTLVGRGLGRAAGEAAGWGAEIGCAAPG